MADENLRSTQTTTRVAGGADTSDHRPHGAQTTGAGGHSQGAGGSQGMGGEHDDQSPEGRTLREQAAENARRAAETARSTANEVSDRVTHQASNIADEAVNRVKSTANEAIREQRDRATGFVSSVERAVEAAARSLNDDGYGQIANYVRYASSTLQSVNQEVGSFEPQRLTGRAERAVRRNPLVTYGALAVAGFALVSLMNAQNRR